MDYFYISSVQMFLMNWLKKSDNTFNWLITLSKTGVIPTQNNILSLQSIPFYIFSESYGGKMAAMISLELTKVTWELF